MKLWPYQFLVLGLDAEGRPLAVLQHAIGTVDGAEVSPGTVLGAMASVAGIKSVVFAHNHPSGNPAPSSADRRLDATLANLFGGSGITVRGSLILQPGRKTFTAYDNAGETPESRTPITPARRSGEVPVVECALRKVQSPEGRTTINGWESAKQAVEALRKQHAAGILLLNTRHDVVGHVPFDPIASRTLRTDKLETSHAKIIRDAVEANAAAVIVYGDRLFERGVDNVSRALRTADVRVLDAFLFDDGVAQSQAAIGKNIGAGPFFSVAAEPEAVKPDVSRVAEQFTHLDDGQRAALNKIVTHRLGETLRQKMHRMTDGWQRKIVQGVFDQFAPLKDLDEVAYTQARLSKGADGAVEGVFRFGPPKLTDGALDIKRDGKGFVGVLQGLNGEHDLFLAWVAGKRAAYLATQGREHLFTPDEITSLNGLANGTMADGRDRAKVYAEAQRTLRRYNDAVLDVAQEAGLLNADNRKQWAEDYYIPFFRAAEAKGGHAGSAFDSLVRQQVIERLKGGGDPLGDLLENVLGNWSHLLTASMRNMAATRALDAAVDLGAAEIAKKGDTGTVWTMRTGEQTHYKVTEPLLLDALTMLYHPGWHNPAMQAMGWFKRALTTGVTADPAFRIRNLMRDTISVIAANRIGFNPMRNLVQGWKASEPGSDTYLKLLGGGGAIRFGSMLDGQAANAKRLITSKIAGEAQILDTPAKLKAAAGRAWTWWAEVGDRAETVNRAALYEQSRAAGMNHREASFAARDALDFSLQGKWAAVRFLVQTVPFMNARLQGLYKLGRGAKADPRRFAVVTGAVAMASALLYLANRDDEEFKALPDWVRDTYWWVRIPGTGKAFFVPKPFEVGALGSGVERGTELMLAGDDYRALDFANTMTSILSQQLSMNPVPQMFRPATRSRRGSRRRRPGRSKTPRRGPTPPHPVQGQHRGAVHPRCAPAPPAGHPTPSPW